MGWRFILTMPATTSARDTDRPALAALIRNCFRPTTRKCPSRPTQPFFGNLLERRTLSVSLITGVVVITAGEFDEHARLAAHAPRVVTWW